MDSTNETLSFDGLMVFSATTVGRRERLGDDITAWLRDHPDRVPVDTLVRQSSDARFHCITLLIFWRHRQPEDQLSGRPTKVAA